MMRQNWAILLDAYRELNSRRLFWITLILSAAFVGAFAMLGATDNGLSVLRWHWDIPSGRVIYKTIFDTVIIGGWLTWVATILALVSTATIFPEFVSGGTIDLYLSKPISRLRLFTLKYIAGLLFVTMQVTVVAAGGFLIMGLRAHDWRPAMFLAIPVVVCFFSYIFGICVLLGVWTRSTIAALLLTLVFWAVFALIDRSEEGLLFMRSQTQFQAQQYENEERTAEARRQTALADHHAELAAAFERERQDAHNSAVAAEQSAKPWRIIHSITYGIKLVVPKTYETTGLLQRWMYSPREAEAMAGRRDGNDSQAAFAGNPQQQSMLAGAKESAEELRSRSVAWVIGTSLAFEAGAVLVAAWIFCRRDY